MKRKKDTDSSHHGKDKEQDETDPILDKNDKVPNEDGDETGEDTRLQKEDLNDRETTGLVPAIVIEEPAHPRLKLDVNKAMKEVGSTISISNSSPALLQGCTELKVRLPHLGSNGHLSAHSLRSRAESGQICLEEVAPSNSHIDDERSKNDFWKMSMDVFTSKRRGKSKEDRKLPKNVRSYYKAQDELIKTFEETLHMASNDSIFIRQEEQLKDIQWKANVMAKVTFGLNLLLLIAKLAASILSGSLAVISSLVDSAVDLMSGVVIWWTSRAVKKRDRYVYPEGKTRLEPIAIVILSVIMSVASVQLIGQSIQAIVAMAHKPGQEGAPVIDIPTLVIISFTIVSKLILFIVCKICRSPLVDALAQDHRNDVLSNSMTLIFGYIGYKLWKYADPMGAIVISIYIFISWWFTGAKQIKMLTGYTAKPQFLKKLTWICLNHSKEIRYIDTVRAFHFGTNYIVEVDIVLPETMTLKEAHNIGEPLQQKLEKLPSVERAFVHLDYEFEHDPNLEHKVV